MPLLVCMVGGTVMGFAALGRLGVKGPDVVYVYPNSNVQPKDGTTSVFKVTGRLLMGNITQPVNLK